MLHVPVIPAFKRETERRESEVQSHACYIMNLKLVRPMYGLALSFVNFYVRPCSFFVVSFLFVCFLLQDRAFLCNSGYPGIHSIDKGGLKLKDLPASARIKERHALIPPDMRLYLKERKKGRNLITIQMSKFCQPKF